MKIIKCDRCKKTIKYVSPHLSVIDDEGDEFEYDLCAKCYLQFERFIDNKEVEGEE